MDNSSIAILTTVANFDLYQKTAPLFPNNIQRFVFDGTNGMHGIHSILYMMQKLKDKRIEWLIMVDEDVVFKNPNEVFSIIEKMKEKQFTVCGVRDGGMISHRKENPFVVNTFFSILNFKEIEAIWNKKEVLKNQYIDLNEFRDDLSDLPFQYYITSVYEPYYCFYFWLRRKGKQILFLDSKMDDDGISNYVYYNQKEILCHTWYARSFGTNEKHTKRIELILEKTIQSDIETKESIVKTVFYKKKAFALDQKIKKYYKRICIKLGR